MGDLGQFSGKEVCGNNGEAAAVGQSDAQADEQITDNKIENLEGQPGVEHQHYAEAVDEYRYNQHQFPSECLFSSVFISTNPFLSK